MLARNITLVIVGTLFIGCRTHHGDSSASVKQARARGVFITEYAVPANADLGDYHPIEVWVENTARGDQEIVVRLQGIHQSGERVRVGIAGFDEEQLLGVWSKRNGPPYERWKAPNPLPDKLRLMRGEKSVEIHRKNHP